MRALGVSFLCAARMSRRLLTLGVMFCHEPPQASRLSSVHDENPAWPHIYYTAIVIPLVLVHDVMQNLDLYLIQLYRYPK